MAVTIKDVAKRAGVSHGTVSNVLRGVNTVRLENVRKVERAIRELGYRIDVSARSLKMDTSNTVAIVLPSIRDSLYAQLYTQLSRCIRNEGYDTFLYLTNDIAEEEHAVIAAIEGAKPVGVVIVTCQPKERERFSPLLTDGTPVVFVERSVEGIDCNFVGFQNDDAMYRVVRSLLKENYQRIGLILQSEDYSSEQLCVLGYSNAYNDEKILVNKGYIQYTNGRNEDAFIAAIHLLSLPPPPDAIICSNTQLLSGAMGALRFAPNHVLPRIVAFSEDSWNDNRFNGATLVQRPSQKLGDMISQILLDNIRNPAFFERRQELLNFDGTDFETCFSVRDYSTTETQTLRISMIEGGIADALRAFLPQFYRETGIEVLLETHSHEKLYEVLSQESKHTDIDIFSVDIFWFREMAASGMLADLSKDIDDAVIQELNLQPELFEDFARFNGHTFGVPFHFCNQLLFYRKDLFQRTDLKRMFYEQYKTELKCPSGFSEFNAVARFFTRSYNPESPTSYGTTLGCRFSSAALCEFLPRLWAFGGDVFDSSANVVINSSKAIRALTAYRESFNYANPASKDYWWFEQVDEFANGDTAMMIMYSSYASKLSDRSVSKVIGKVGVGIIPGSSPVLGGWSLCINNNSRNYDAALRFIKWASDKKNAIPMLLLGNQPTCRTVYTSNEIRDIYPWIPKSLEYFPLCRQRTIPVSASKIKVKDYEEIIATAVCESVSGDKSPTDALNIVAEQFHSIIDASA